MASLEYKFLFNDSNAGTNWEVHITKNWKSVGKGNFRVMSNKEYRQQQFLEGRIDNLNPSFSESLSEVWQNIRRWL